MSADRKWRTTGFLFPGCPARVAGVGKFFEVSYSYEQVSTLNLNL